MITVQAKAKINLTLDVLHKRDDGYHEVKMIMQALDLSDTLQLTLQDHGRIHLEVNNAKLPTDARNLAFKAAALLQKTFHIKSGVHMSLQKNIPVAAGLAGGSADAAGVLTGLNKLWGLGLSMAELSKLAAMLGSDVPFCLQGGTMLATGRGEILTPLPGLAVCHVVLAKPRIGVSTAWVYRQYQGEAVRAHPDTEGMIQCLQQQDASGIAKRLCNVLESVTIAAFPEISHIKAWMLEYGASASLMSGSGPTVFGLADSQNKAEYIAQQLKKHIDAEIMVTKTSVKVGGENGEAIITH